MDLSLELIKEQHSSVSLVYAKYFFDQAALCVNYFSDFCFWPKFQAQHVKTFKQML